MATATALFATASPSAAAGGPLSGEDTARADAVVTLITGDQATVHYDANGIASAVLKTEEDYYTTRDGQDLYVVPASAQAAINAGTLDPQLFNVTGLVRSGYDDANRDDIPLIVTGAPMKTRGVTTGVTLDAIGASAITVDKDNTESLFTAATTARSERKIWLDAKVEGYGELDPATGVPQTGADEVWLDGYTGEGTTVAVLDTGYDAEHPDLTGRVVGSADFTEGDGPFDYEGHGTHVASTIAGTGEASEGSRAGMAPDADLLIGKVLGFGGGQESWIIAGMQWAVDNGADVVNMSLGSSEPTDCTDPMSQAVNELGSGDTLFVIAAGNAGLPQSVSSPGCADAALTVGAVDSDSETARFSSRGPTLDNRVKPDIAAPGVDILGAALGSSGDNHYRRMSGTSMASPHVAGAAALIKQAHPDWTAQQIKQALTSAVKESPKGGVYDQGAGEMWVPGAIDTDVIATSSVSVGEFAWPHNGRETHSETITYTNVSDEKVKLDLSIDGLVGPDGSKVTKKSVFLDRKKVTINPGESADVTLVVTDRVKNLDASTYGAIGGRVIATGDDDTRVTTAFGYQLEPETVDLTIKATDRDGEAATLGNIVLFHTDELTAQQVPLTGETTTLRVRAGTVSINGFLAKDLGDYKYEYTYVGVPEKKITKNTTIELDATDAVEVTVDGDRDFAVGGGTLRYARIIDDYWYVGGSINAREDARLYVVPTEKKVKTGYFGFGSYWRMYEPGVDHADSSYVYNLSFTETGRVTAQQNHKVTDRSLAKVNENWYAQGTDSTYYDLVTALDPVTGEQVAAGGGTGAVNTPTDRTAYYTPDVGWTQMASSGRMMVETFIDPTRTYEAGETYEVDWYRSPSPGGMFYAADGTPARIAERQHNLMGFSFSPWKDSTPGRSGVGGFGDMGNLQLSENGVDLGTSAWPSGQWEISGEPARYDATVTQMRMPTSWNKGWNVGTGTVTTFSFDSQRPNGDDVTALPLHMPTYTMDVDRYNATPAANGFAIAVDFVNQDGHDPAEIKTVKAQISPDDISLFDGTPIEDHNWIDVTVQKKAGTWYVLIDNSDFTGTYPSLHLTATDSQGNSVDQYTLNMYGVA